MWEDFRHGMFFGSLEFVEKMGKRYLPDTPHKEQPQQRNTIRASDPRILLKKTAAALNRMNLSVREGYSDQPKSTGIY